MARFWSIRQRLNQRRTIRFRLPIATPTTVRSGSWGSIAATKKTSVSRLTAVVASSPEISRATRAVLDDPADDVAGEPVLEEADGKPEDVLEEPHRLGERQADLQPRQIDLLEARPRPAGPGPSAPWRSAAA